MVLVVPKDERSNLSAYHYALATYQPPFSSYQLAYHGVYQVINLRSFAYHSGYHVIIIAYHSG